MGYRDGSTSDIHESEARHKAGAGETRKGVAANEPISPNPNQQDQAREGVTLHTTFNHSNRPARTRMPGWRESGLCWPGPYCPN